jgi:hypothetical protein
VLAARSSRVTKSIGGGAAAHRALVANDADEMSAAARKYGGK